MEGTIKIKSNIKEKDLIELCISYHLAGYEYRLPLVFHALANSWNITTLTYYLNLIESI